MMGKEFYAMPMRFWQAGFNMWMQGIDMQMSMMRAMLPQSSQERAEAVGDAAADMTREGGEAAEAGVDFARKAAQSLAGARDDKSMPV